MGIKVATRSVWTAGAAVALAGLARLAWAGPLDTAVVDKNANWMFHLDVEAGLASTCGRLVSKEAADAPELRTVVTDFGINPLKDVKSMTVYGFKAGEDDGVAVLVTTNAVDQLGPKLEAAKAQELEVRVQDGVTRYSWKHEGHPWHIGVRAAEGEQRFVVLASSTTALDLALDVVSGAKPSLKTLDAGQADVAPMLERPSKGSILFVAAKGLGDSAKFKSSLIKGSRSLVVDVGEETGAESAAREVYARVTLKAADAPSAATMQQAIQLLIAVTSIGANGNDAKGIAQSLQGIKVTSDDVTVLIAARENSEQLIAKLKGFAAGIEAAGDGKMSVSLKKSGADPDNDQDKDPEAKVGKKAPEKKH